MSSEGKTIIDNLKERVHAVNTTVAIHGIDDISTAVEVLEQLVNENIVICEYQKLPDGTAAPLYRYNRFRPGLHARKNIRIV